MNKNLINFTAEDIYNKDFKQDIKGYNIKEVDRFLNLVIKDYNEFNRQIELLEQEKEESLQEIIALKQEIRNLKTSVEITKSGANDSISNLDVLKRLSQLEKIVYGKDE